MPVSTSSRTVHHYYFNYLRPKPSSLWIRSGFTRRVQFAFQMVVAFIASGFLAYGSPLNNQLAVEYFIPVMSVLCLQETFGLTLSACFHIVLGTVPLSILLFVVQKIGLGYQDYLAAEFVLLISSLYPAYRCSEVNIFFVLNI
jgi:hypothetical protein